TRAESPAHQASRQSHELAEGEQSLSRYLPPRLAASAPACDSQSPEYGGAWLPRLREKSPYSLTCEGGHAQARRGKEDPCQAGAPALQPPPASPKEARVTWPRCALQKVCYHESRKNNQRA